MLKPYLVGFENSDGSPGKSSVSFNAVPGQESGQGSCNQPQSADNQEGEEPMVWIAPEGDRDHTHYRERQQQICCRQQSESDHRRWHDVLVCGERFLQLRLEHLNARVNEIQQLVSDFCGNAAETALVIAGVRSEERRVGKECRWRC